MDPPSFRHHPFAAILLLAILSLVSFISLANTRLAATIPDVLVFSAEVGVAAIIIPTSVAIYFNGVISRSVVMRYKPGPLLRSLVTTSLLVATVCLSYLGEKSLGMVIFFFGIAGCLLTVQMVFRPAANLGIYDFLITSAALQGYLYSGENMGLNTWISVVFSWLFLALRNYCLAEKDAAAVAGAAVAHGGTIP